MGKFRVCRIKNGPFKDQIYTATKAGLDIDFVEVDQLSDIQKRALRELDIFKSIALSVNPTFVDTDGTQKQIYLSHPITGYAIGEKLTSGQIAKVEFTGEDNLARTYNLISPTASETVLSPMIWDNQGSEIPLADEIDDENIHFDETSVVRYNESTNTYIYANTYSDGFTSRLIHFNNLYSIPLGTIENAYTINTNNGNTIQVDAVGRNPFNTKVFKRDGNLPIKYFDYKVTWNNLSKNLTVLANEELSVVITFNDGKKIRRSITPTCKVFMVALAPKNADREVFPYGTPYFFAVNTVK